MENCLGVWTKTALEERAMRRVTVSVRKDILMAGCEGGLGGSVVWSDLVGRIDEACS